MKKDQKIFDPLQLKIISLCQTGRVENLEKLFEEQLKLDKSFFDVCFMITCQNFQHIGDYEEVLMFLLNKGANINLKEKPSDRTPLIVAIQNKSGCLVKFLLDNNADSNLCDKENRSPLWHVAKQDFEDNTEILQMLLENGAIPEIEAKDNTNPIQIMLKKKAEKACMILIKKSNNFSYVEKTTGNTYLHLAAYRNMENIVKLLIKKGMENSNNLNKDCKLPSDLTINDNIIGLLKGKQSTKNLKNEKTAEGQKIKTKNSVKAKQTLKGNLSLIDNKTKQRSSLKSHSNEEKVNKKGSKKKKVKAYKKSLTNISSQFQNTVSDKG